MRNKYYFIKSKETISSHDLEMEETIQTILHTKNDDK